MRFVSTRGRSPAVSFREAMFGGLAPDGGLYVPERIAPIAIHDLAGASLTEIAEAVIAPYLAGEVASHTLASLVRDALNFPIPLVQIGEQFWALELFHGPTYAFKDVGARVMARILARFATPGAPLTVLVATSGDTGGAVAQAFHGVAGTRVVVLFPEGQVSPTQEAQFATLGGNVTAVAVRGSFDDCQRLVKEAFADASLRAGAALTSANSINVARLLPQMVYYVHAAAQVGADEPALFSVPSGNFGNLTAGVMARAAGAPIAQFVAATTVNDTWARFLATAAYEPRSSVTTLANAMDVGDPSNIERLRWLLNDDLDLMRGLAPASVHHDDEVRSCIADLYSRTGYLCDPHGAIACLGASRAREARHPAARPSLPIVFLATAHPAKFAEVVEPLIGHRVPLPHGLAEALTRPRHVERIAASLDALRAVL
jgi:threonine synthase